jgi:hypothetical protein
MRLRGPLTSSHGVLFIGLQDHRLGIGLDWVDTAFGVVVSIP